MTSRVIDLEDAKRRRNERQAVQRGTDHLDSLLRAVEMLPWPASQVLSAGMHLFRDQAHPSHHGLFKVEVGYTEADHGSEDDKLLSFRFLSRVRARGLFDSTFELIDPPKFAHLVFSKQYVDESITPPCIANPSTLLFAYVSQWPEVSANFLFLLYGACNALVDAGFVLNNFEVPAPQAADNTFKARFYRNEDVVDLLVDFSVLDMDHRAVKRSL